MADGLAQLSIDPASVARLQDEMRRMQEATGADMAKVVRNTGRDLTFELIRRIPMAKKFQSMRIPGRGGVYWVATLHRHTREPVIFPGSREQAEKYGLWGTRKRVTGRGYARAVLFPVLRGLGVEPRTVFRQRRKGRAPSDFTVFRERLSALIDPSVTIGSASEYIDKLDARANVLSGAVNAVAGKMQERAQRIIERNAQRTTTRLAQGLARSFA